MEQNLNTSTNKIKKMPSRETLEEFLDSLEDFVKVIFDKEKGEFIRIKKIK